MSFRRRSGFGLSWIAAAVLFSMGASQAERDRFDRLALARILNPPLGLPPVSVPAANPPTLAKIRLGRKLFLDRRLSHNGTLSCAMCHVPEQGFTVNELRTPVGKEGKSLRRNAPTLLNVAYMRAFFHDGREPELDLQAFDVFLDADEMAAVSLGAVVAKIESLPGYRALFEEAFHGPPAVESIGQAVGTYLRTLLAADSPFDRWFFGNDEEALSASAQRGFRLFSGSAECTTCHQIGENHALFTDQQFHDTGLGWYNSMVKSKQNQPVEVRIAPGVVAQMERSVLDSVGNPPAPDLGRYEVTLDPKDRWLFRTPSLRNVALTAPYMHDGSFSSLSHVLEFYRKGGHRHPGLDPALRPLDLDDEDSRDLEAFLESLTGAGIEELIRDARSETVGNPGDPPP